MTTIRRVVLAGLAALAATVAAAGGPGIEAAIPTLLWDPDRRVVFVSPPAVVAAWMAGQIDDPDGTLQRLAAAYEWQRQSDGFGGAVLELQEIVRTAADRHGLGATDINVRLIPDVLHARDDLRGALLGTEPAFPLDPGECWEELAGKIGCVEWWGVFCFKVSCRSDAANTCTIFMPCKSGHQVPGVGVGAMSNFN